MAITLPNASRSAACNAVVDLIDAGSAEGKLKLKASNDTVLCVVTLNKPAFGAAANGVAALDTDPALSGTGESAAGAGTDATKFDFTDSDDNVVFSGVVGEGSGELQMVNSNIADGQTVNITGYNHTQPA